MLEFLEQRDSFPSWNLLDCTVWVCKKEDRHSFVIPGRALNFRGEVGRRRWGSLRIKTNSEKPREARWLKQFELLDQALPEVRIIFGLSNHMSQYVPPFCLSQSAVDFVSVKPHRHTYDIKNPNRNDGFKLFLNFQEEGKCFPEVLIMQSKA